MSFEEDEHIMTDADILDDIRDEEFRQQMKGQRIAKVQRAERYLDEHYVDGEYNWLLASDAKKWWPIREVAKEMGIPVRTLQRWCLAGEIEGARNWGKKAGWGLPRSGLLLFFGSERAALAGTEEENDTSMDDDELEED